MATLIPAPASSSPPFAPSRHDSLLRDLLIFLEDVGNMACDSGFYCLEHRADQLYVRVKRELEA